MTEFRRILVPTDLTACARLALRHGVHLAQKTGAELHLIHVIEEIEGGNMPGIGDLKSGYSRVNEVLSVEMRVQVREMAGEGFQAQQEIRHGAAAAPGILDYAVEHDIDLIVMGIHGRQGADRFLIGSTAERMVRFAECNVLTVGPSGAWAADIIQSIVVTIDFSVHSEGILRWAYRLSNLYNSSLYLLHVIEPVLRPTFYGGDHLGFDFNRSRVSDQVRAELKRLTRRVGDQDDSHRLLVTRGRAGQEITRLTKEHKIEMIVQGAYGLTDDDNLQVGHTAEEVVRNAPCPVFTVKEFKS